MVVSFDRIVVLGEHGSMILSRHTVEDLLDNDLGGHFKRHKEHAEEEDTSLIDRLIRVR
jgi:hypothetical protein